jgi:hypothetical protein
VRHRRLSVALALAAGAAMLASLAGPALGASAATRNNARAAHLVAQSFAASQGASTVTVTGRFVNGKETISIHVTDTKDGNGFGTLRVQNYRLHIVQADGANYFKTGAGYWGKIYGSKTALYVGLYANHWVKSSSSETNSPGKVFSAFLNKSTFLGGFNTRGVRWVVTGHTTFHGQPVTEVRGTQRGMTGTLLIAAKGQPFLMAIEPPQGQGRITFANWDKPVTVRAPKRWVPFTPPQPTGNGTPTSIGGGS